MESPEVRHIWYDTVLKVLLVTENFCFSCHCMKALGNREEWGIRSTNEVHWDHLRGRCIAKEITFGASLFNTLHACVTQFNFVQQSVTVYNQA